MKHKHVVLIKFIGIVMFLTLMVSGTGSKTNTVLAQADGWPMVAANPQRTSWTPDEVSGNLQIEWYRPIEAYISQNTQIIASNGLLFISTARGLYALNAANGEVAWRFDTKLPLGNSPTVADGVVYVGGYDRKLHALDLNGNLLWSFDGAQAGYSSNPLVIEGKVILGNRDGTMYAIGAHGTPDQGNLLWQYKTGGPIYLSAAYNAGVIYFAAGDNHAYALDANDGHLIWKSEKLPGEQYQSYWPVIFRDKVIFSAAHGYRSDLKLMQLHDIFGTDYSEGQIIGPQDPSQNWAHGFPILDAHRITEYLEDNPEPDTYKHKPWRRMFIVLNTIDGQEFTFDSDNDDHPEYIPVSYWGTASGNRYPPIVGTDGILYYSNLYQCCSDAKGRIMGWHIDYPGYLSLLGSISAPTGGYAALAEPQAISAGGNIIYRNLCCDRIGDWVNYINSGQRGGQAWFYNLGQQAPGYDPMWFIDPGAISRHRGWYNGNSNSMNAAYHNHGDQNPIIPYNGRIFVHRSNTIFAFGPGNGPGALPVLLANPGEDTSVTLPISNIVSRLENEVQKIVDAGHLRPGYYNASTLVDGVENYFENPGDTLYTLAMAYPYLSAGLQSQVRTYLQNEFDTYFDNEMYARTGWSSGAPREAMELPPEVANDIAAGNYPPSVSTGTGGFLWYYPQHNFYAMWKYAENVPDVNPQTLYNLAKSKLMVPAPTPPAVFNMTQTDYFRQQPYELNAWIAGYIGFLELQELAGMSGTDAALRNQVSTELDRLLNLRISIFTKESYWNNPYSPDYRFYKKDFDIVRNFLFMVPELAEYLRQNKLEDVQAAVDEYEYIAPYWFVSRYEASIGERGRALLYHYYSLFQAKALILEEPAEELSKYIDVPGFAVGDLLYIQNLIATLERAGYNGISLSVKPSLHNVDPGDTGTYTIDVQHVLTMPVTIMVPSSSPELNIQLSQTTIVSPGGQSTLTLTDLHPPDFSMPYWHKVPITVIDASGEISRTLDVGLLINGIETYLPVITKRN